MKALNFSRLLQRISVAAGMGLMSPSAPGQDLPPDILPPIPTIRIRATVPETREPFCDPAICDAAPPPPGVFVVSREAADLTGELVVFLTPEGTAAGGTDYPSLPTSVFFKAGVEAVELRVDAAYDFLAEGDETVIARLQPDPSMGPIERYRLDPKQSVAEVVIHDRDTPAGPVIRIEATDRIAEESSFPLRRLALRGRVTLTRTGATDTPVSVFLLTRGTATPGVDYPALPMMATIPAGADHVELEIVPIPDSVAEPIETIDIELSECPPVTDPPLGMPCVDVAIDPSHAAAHLFVRDDGITTASLVLTAPRDGATVPFGEPIRLAATALDLDGAITHVEFADGGERIGESSIIFIREPDPGTPIDHEFAWAKAGPGAHELTARAVNAAGRAVTSPPVRLKVTDGLPVVSIRASEPETTEPSPTTRVRPGVLRLSRTGVTDAPLSVWVHYGGTAAAGLDYSEPPAVVEFPAGAATTDVLIGPIDDDLDEGDETVVAELVPSPLGARPNYQIDPANQRARVTIHDNDEPAIPVVSLRATVVETREPILCLAGPCPLIPDMAPAVITISRTGSAKGALEVWYFIGGSARNGADYQRLPNRMTIPAGSASVEIPVSALPDDRSEGDETVVMQLSLPPFTFRFDGWLSPPYRIDRTAPKATALIHDSPLAPPATPTVSITAVDPLAREGLTRGGETDPAVFVVTRTGSVSEALTVHFILGGTASGESDYAPLPSPLAISAGERSARLIVMPLDDKAIEGIETVSVSLVAPDPANSPYALGFPSRAAAVLLDNDRPRPLCQRLPDGFFNLCLPVETGDCGRVEVSDDCKEWTPLCTIPVTDGTAHFVDPDAAGIAQRFYRIVPAPCEP